MGEATRMETTEERAAMDAFLLRHGEAYRAAAERLAREQERHTARYLFGAAIFVAALTTGVMFVALAGDAEEQRASAPPAAAAAALPVARLAER